MIRSVAFFVVVTAVTVALGSLFGLYGLIVGILAAAAIDISLFFFSARVIIWMYKAAPLDDKKILKIVDELAQEAKIRLPKIFVIDEPAPNAFVVGNSINSSIAVTKGLLEMETSEIKSVLAHEVGHIRNYDVLLASASAVLASALSLPAQWGYSSLFFAGEREDKAKFLGLVAAVLFSPPGFLTVRLSLSRVMEYRADFTASMLTKDAHSLSKSLKKIYSVAKNEPMKGMVATSHLWIINPFQKNWFTSLFSSHPPVEMRIKRLEELEGFKE